MKVSKDQVLGALPGFSASDLMALQAAIGHLLVNVSAPVDQTAQKFFDALVAAIGASTAYSSYSPTATRQFEKRLPDLTKFLNTHFTGWDKNKVGQIAFLKMLFGLLADDMRGRGVNPTIGIMVVNMGRIAEVVENAFPKYLESGMASIILKNFR